MRLLLYYMVHTFINAIKKLFKSWVAVIIVVSIGFGILVGLTITVATNIVASQNPAVEEFAEEMDEEEEEDIDFPMTAEEKQILYQNVTLIVLGITLIILILNIYPSKRTGEDLFTMADVNLLLTAPIKPQTILLYKTILKMGVMLLSTLYVMAQIPNLILNLELPVSYAFALIGVWFLMSVFCKIASILTYTLTAGKEWAKNIVRRGIPIIALIFGVIVFVVMKSQEVGILEAARIVFLSQPAMAIPMIGWITGITNSIFSENLTAGLVYLALIVVGYAVMVYIIWHVKVDFYEDSITKASSLFQRTAEAKSGMKTNRKHKKESKTNEIGKGQGASCFLTNQFYTRKRFAYFGLITKTGVSYIGLSVLGSLFLTKLVETSNFAGLGLMFLLICYIRNYGNPIAREMQMSYIYMIPESAFSKLWYSIFGSALITALDILPAIVIGGIMMRANVINCIGWLLLITSFDFMLSNTGLLVDLILPTFIPDSVKAMFAMFLKMFGVMPLLVVLVLAIALPYVTFIGVSVNVFFGILFLLVSSKLFTVGRS